MLLNVSLCTKGSFLGSLINKCRPAAAANLSSSAPTYMPKTLEEKIGLPPKPKKPLTPFFRYMAEQRGKVIAANPNLRLPDIVKQVASGWEKLDVSLKHRLQEEFKKDQQQYLEARTKYDAKITDEQRSKLKELKREIAVEKEKRLMRKRIRQLERPKKPASAFLRFLAKERTVTPQKANETFREWHQKVTARWGTLTDEQKNVFLEEAREEREIYKKQLSLWEEKMIRAGNIDVVRTSKLVDPLDPTLKKQTQNP